MRLKHVAQIYRDDEFLAEIGILLAGIAPRVWWQLQSRA